MKVICAILGVTLSCCCAKATITLNVNAAELKGAGGVELMPLGGQVFLVASTGDGLFGSPRADYFVSGDEVILFRWSLTDAGDGPGYFSDTTGSINLGSFTGLNPGDLLQLYWFPTLTDDATVPGDGTAYGFYRSDLGEGLGGAPWVVPSDGSLVTLNFFTESSGLGTNPDSFGWADYTVAPVPEAGNVIFGGLALGLVAFRLFPQLRRKFAKN
jgi:hypothetical protein